MTDNAKAILNYFKAHFGEEFTKQQVALAVGVSMPAVTRTCTNQCDRGHMVERVEESVDEKGKKVVTKYVSLTQAGFDYDPIAEEAEKAEIKAAEKAAKAAARLAAKEAKEAANA